MGEHYLQHLVLRLHPGPPFVTCFVTSIRLRAVRWGEGGWSAKSKVGENEPKKTSESCQPPSFLVCGGVLMCIHPQNNCNIEILG